MARSHGRSRGAVLCLALLWALTCCPALCWATRTLAQQSETRLSGRAIVLGHDAELVFAVHTRDGRRVVVQLSSPAQIAGVHTGMQVQVTGSWVQPAGAARPVFQADTLTASGAAVAQPTLTVERSSGGAVAAATTAAGAAAAATVLLSTNKLVRGTVPTIFIPIAGLQGPGSACPGSQLPKATADQVRQAVFEEMAPGKPTVGSTFNKCSYGKTQLTANNSLVADVVELPCSGVGDAKDPWSFQTCEFNDYNGIADAANAVLRARGINLDKYLHKIYLLPPGACTFVGLGYQGCDGSYECRVWIGADFWKEPSAMAHEIGHNLFLAHAGAEDKSGAYDEYGDLSGVMGYCCTTRCPNTPHAWQLGWVSVQQLDGRSLKPGQTATVALSTQSTSQRSGLRIVPTWAAGAEPIFVGYRTRAGGDIGAVATAVAANLPGVPVAIKPGRVLIYSANITNTYDGKTTNWKAGLSSPSSKPWQHPQTGLVVRMVSSNRDAAVVTVCRKAGAETRASCQAGADNDCNGLVGVKDPACLRWLRRTRRNRAA